MDLLVIPYPLDPTLNIIRWPLFLLPGKVRHNPFKIRHICELFLFLTVCLPLQVRAALNIATQYGSTIAERQRKDSELWRLICRDEFMKFAVLEMFDSAKQVLHALKVTENEKRYLQWLVPYHEKHMFSNFKWSNILDWKKIWYSLIFYY